MSLYVVPALISLNFRLTSNGTSTNFVAKSDLITFPVNKYLEATLLTKLAAKRNSGPSGMFSLTNQSLLNKLHKQERTFEKVT